MSSKDMLLEMGFTPEKVEAALSATNNSGIEAAMEWLLVQQESNLSATSGPSGETKDESAPLSVNDVAESKNALTEEERKEQIKKLEEKMKQRRIEREKQDQIDSIEREKQRIQSGKQLAEAKQRLQDAEMKKLTEERKREKMEANAARQKVLQQIEEDKRLRKLNAQGFTPEPKPQTPPVPISIGNKQYDSSRIQVRLTNGEILTQTFNAKEQLSAVRLFIEMNRTDGEGPFGLMTSFPRKVFLGDEYETPLDALGLVPSAVLIVTKTSS